MTLTTHWRLRFQTRARQFRYWLRAQRCRAFGHQDQVLEPIGTGVRCLRCGRTSGGWVTRRLYVARRTPPIGMDEVRAQSRRAVAQHRQRH